ncbi:MAG TPA: hypothetical protein VKJ01_17340 [Candidatus Solibacter sp.]|nr:hypothetical protein [Candidatus Solibacter sp.]
MRAWTRVDPASESAITRVNSGTVPPMQAAGSPIKTIVLTAPSHSSQPGGAKLQVRVANATAAKSEGKIRPQMPMIASSKA